MDPEHPNGSFRSGPSGATRKEKPGSAPAPKAPVTYQSLEQVAAKRWTRHKKVRFAPDCDLVNEIPAQNPTHDAELPAQNPALDGDLQGILRTSSKPFKGKDVSPPKGPRSLRREQIMIFETYRSPEAARGVIRTIDALTDLTSRHVATTQLIAATMKVLDGPRADDFGLFEAMATLHFSASKFRDCLRYILDNQDCYRLAMGRGGMLFELKRFADYLAPENTGAVYRFSALDNLLRHLRELMSERNGPNKVLAPCTAGMMVAKQAEKVCEIVKQFERDCELHVKALEQKVGRSKEKDLEKHRKRNLERRAKTNKEEGFGVGWGSCTASTLLPGSFRMMS